MLITTQVQAVAQAHKSEILRNADGKWYIPTGNEMAGGGWLAPPHPKDGPDDQSTPVPVAGW